MKLSEAQCEFTRMVAKLINFATDHGYGLTFGEAYRTEEQAEIYAAKGIGIKNSLHCMRLAVDFNLFKNGKYCPMERDYKELGEYWESIGGTWGGKFNDGDHFSFAWEGVK